MPLRLTDLARRLFRRNARAAIRATGRYRLGLESLEGRDVPSVTAGADAYSVHQGKTLDVAAPGVLANDSSGGSYGLTASLVSGVSHGTLTLLSGGRFQYRPAAGYVGPDSFVYQASDGHGGTATATVSLSVTNTPPVGVGDTYAVARNGSLRVSAPGLLGNDSDADADALNAVLVSGPANGRVWLTYNGSFVYTPNANYAGPDSFVYRATDGAQDTGPVTVGINVAGTTPPTAANDSYTTSANQTLTVSAPGVLANDSDPNGNALTAALVSGPSNGILTLNPNGGFTYTPTAGFVGADSFTYRATNGVSNSGTATVSITVTNVPPVAVDDTASYTGSPVVIPVLANDNDPNGDSLVVLDYSLPARGTLTLNPDGTFTFVPTDTGPSGTDEFTYTVSDGRGGTATATVRVAVGSTVFLPIEFDEERTESENANDPVGTTAGPLVVPYREYNDKVQEIGEKAKGKVADIGVWLHTDVDMNNANQPFRKAKGDYYMSDESVAATIVALQVGDQVSALKTKVTNWAMSQGIQNPTVETRIQVFYAVQEPNLNPRSGRVVHNILIRFRLKGTDANGAAVDAAAGVVALTQTVIQDGVKTGDYR